MRKDRQRELFTKLYHGCIANRPSINNDKTNFVMFHINNKPVPRNFTCTTTEAMQINRIKSVKYLGMVFGENLYWHDHVDQTCASLVKFFGIFNHVKH